ncbi:hypothetical protein HPB51_009462 [Rhipicephalus microplus]|uniref:Uncharacterized protein n=1 Tax=Rhipicephalus microplus TaxID=6941 RepID=A0A9J6DUM3_RHIMP|nr:hypothetical protein HPB51_009462 [Rhipicephalus microplus]
MVTVAVRDGNTAEDAPLIGSSTVLSFTDAPDSPHAFPTYGFKKAMSQHARAPTSAAPGQLRTNPGAPLSSGLPGDAHSARIPFRAFPLLSSRCALFAFSKPGRIPLESAAHIAVSRKGGSKRLPTHLSGVSARSCTAIDVPPTRLLASSLQRPPVCRRVYVRNGSAPEILNSHMHGCAFERRKQPS